MKIQIVKKADKKTPSSGCACSVAAHTELGDMNRPNCHKSSFEAGVVSLARDAATRELATIN